MKDANTITMSMELVGFTKEETKNRTLQQQVRCLVNQQTVQAVIPPSAIKASDSMLFATSELLSPANLMLESSSISSLKWNTNVTKSGKSQQRIAAEEPQGGTMLEDCFAAVDDSMALATVPIKPPIPTKKTRHSPHQLQECHSHCQRMKDNEKAALKVITAMVDENCRMFPDPKDKCHIAVSTVVEKVNAIHGSNVSACTAR